MFRALAFLIGSSVIAAVFAGIYYGDDNEQARVEGSPAFNLAPGEVRQDGLGPTVEGSPISVEIQVLSGEVDIYVMPKEWAAALPKSGSLRLDESFGYSAENSATHVNESHTFTLISDGRTWYSVVFDNSDNYYEGDSVPENETAQLKVIVRYTEDEDRSLLLGYLATIPSVLLVVVTFGRQWMRHRRNVKAEQTAEAAQR